ncbi:MAG: DUF4388 domain-containing protein [Acidobacteria bacterium]|nr:MAG: DUF4388 domain-containing protein [Acidobacteriota bacterium]
MSRSNQAVRVKTPEAEGTIYFQDGEIVHAACPLLEGEEALARMLSWRSDDYEILPAELVLHRSIFREFDSLLNAIIAPREEGGATSEPQSLTEATESTTPLAHAPSPRQVSGQATQAPRDVHPPTEPASPPEVSEATTKKESASPPPPITPSREEAPETGPPQLSEKQRHAIRQALAPLEHIEGGALIDEQGHVLVSTLPEAMLESSTMETLGTLIQACHRSTERLGRGLYHQSFIQGDAGYLIISEAGESLFLLLLASAKAKLGLVLLQARQRAQSVSEIVASSATDDA